MRQKDSSSRGRVDCRQKVHLSSNPPTVVLRSGNLAQGLVSMRVRAFWQSCATLAIAAAAATPRLDSDGGPEALKLKSGKKQTYPAVKLFDPENWSEIWILVVELMLNQIISLRAEPGERARRGWQVWDSCKWEKRLWPLWSRAQASAQCTLATRAPGSARYEVMRKMKTCFLQSPCKLSLHPLPRPIQS